MKFIISKVLVLILLSATGSQTAFAESVLDIDGINETPPSGHLNKLPISTSAAFKEAQDTLLYSVIGKSNWKLSREIDIKILSIKLYDSQTGFRDSFNNKVGQIIDGINDKINLPLLSFFGLDVDLYNYHMKDVVYDKQDCDMPTGEVTVQSKSLNFRKNRIFKVNALYKGDFEYKVLFNLYTWTCPSGATSAKESGININWEAIVEPSQSAIDEEFANTFKQNLPAKYMTDVKIGSQQDQGIIFMQDPKENEKGCRIESKSDTGSDIPNSKLKSASIMLNGTDVQVVIKSNGQLSKLKKDESVSYELGFDLGNGNKVTGSYRNGVDTIFIVDASNSGLAGFKDIFDPKTKKFKEAYWKPINAQKLEDGVLFSLGLAEIGNPAKLPPLRIFLSSYVDSKIKMDYLPKEGMKICL